MNMHLAICEPNYNQIRKRDLKKKIPFAIYQCIHILALLIVIVTRDN